MKELLIAFPFVIGLRDAMIRAQVTQDKGK